MRVPFKGFSQEERKRLGLINNCILGADLDGRQTKSWNVFDKIYTSRHCSEKECMTCGWNPVVAEKRKHEEEAKEGKFFSGYEM